MKIKVVCLGDKMPTWVNQGVKEYQKRLHNSSIQLQFIEIPIVKRTKNSNKDKWLKDEAKLILQKISKDDYIVTLDIKAQIISTEILADKISHWQNSALSITVIIGGPDGIDQTIKSKSMESISFSKMTFPHPIVRIILTEQLYRAWSILKNHPYHK